MLDVLHQLLHLLELLLDDVVFLQQLLLHLDYQIGRNLTLLLGGLRSQSAMKSLCVI